MAFLSCEEMLAAARSQKITLAEAVLRSDLEESRLTGSDTLTLTHDAIAQHLGSAREGITRMLRYFSSEGLVKLGRGSLQVLDTERLIAIAGDSLR